MSNLSAESLNGLAGGWADIMWAVSWQYCVLGLAVLIVHCLLRTAAPNVRYWLWQILAIKLLCMPFWTAALPWNLFRPADESPVVAPGSGSPATTKSTVASPTTQQTDSQPVLNATRPLSKHEPSVPDLSAAPAKNSTTPVVSSAEETQTPKEATLAGRSPEQLADIAGRAIHISPHVNADDSSVSLTEHRASSALSWKAWLMLAWLLGGVWYTSRIVGQGLALWRRLRTAQPADSQFVQRVRDAAAKLNLSRVPQVLILDEELSPFVCGLWRPTLVMPRAVTQTFTPEQLDLVLLHELSHILRRDLIWGWIPEIGRVLFFFHPFVYVVCNQIRFERELACDQLAMMSSGRDAATYADTLVKVAGQASGAHSATLAAVERSQV